MFFSPKSHTIEAKLALVAFKNHDKEYRMLNEIKIKINKEFRKINSLSTFNVFPRHDL